MSIHKSVGRSLDRLTTYSHGEGKISWTAGFAALWSLIKYLASGWILGASPYLKTGLSNLTPSLLSGGGDSKQQEEVPCQQHQFRGKVSTMLVITVIDKNPAEKQADNKLVCKEMASPLPGM